MTRTQMVIIAALFGVAFAVNSALRGHVAPGLVGGALGNVLLFLVLLRVRDHHAALRRPRASDEHG